MAPYRSGFGYSCVGEIHITERLNGVVCVCVCLSNRDYSCHGNRVKKLVKQDLNSII